MLAILRRNLRAHFDVTRPTFDILFQLQRAQKGPTMSEPSTRLLVSKGNVTDLVTRLERRGLLEHRADRRDARVQHVHPTSADEKLIRQLVVAHDRWLMAMTAELGRRPLLSLHRAFGALGEVLANVDGQGQGASAPRGTLEVRKPNGAKATASSVQPRRSIRR